MSERKKLSNSKIKLSDTSNLTKKNLNSRIYTSARIRRRARIVEANENFDGSVFAETGLHTKNEKKPMSDLSVPFAERMDSEKKILVASNPNKSTSKNLSVLAGAGSLPESQGHRNSSGSDHSIENFLSLKTSSSRNLSASGLGSLENAPAGGLSENIKPISMKMMQKIKILTTLLPDEILSDPISRKPKLYNTAVIFPDVSGFTQLCEKYDKTGKGGPSRLTEVLNGYLGSMIQIVLSRKGDIFKFGGDAFLCVWKVPVNRDIKEIVYLAIESAVDIQKNCGEHNTDVGVKLGVKIAVAAGKAMFSIIGSESRKHYVLVGPPVLDVREAESLCRSGDVIVAPSAWQHVENYMLYSYTYHSNNSHIKVHDFGPLWKPVSAQLKTTENDNESIRPLLKVSSRLKVENLRPFILTPIMKSIDLNQSLDYLTEMRQVAIVFFNVAVDFRSMPLEELIDLSHRVFQIITSIVDKSDGAVNKLTLFDKDMAILVVFGLKGFKHELPSQVALKCAFNCLEQLKKLPIISAAAAVTTGMAYCGVIGHVMRREYTVMGRPVNMAARLMCVYPNIVSTDRDTFLHSKLESGHFEVLEQKFLKGIQQPGLYYKFNLHLKRSKLKLDYYAYPLLGRAKEIHEFEKFLENGWKNKENVNFMIVYGKARIGKTRLIANFVNIAEKLTFTDDKSIPFKKNLVNNLEINIISLTEDDSKLSYSVTKLIFQQPLGFSDSSSVEEREDKIASKLGETRDVFLLAAFNPIFNVNFELMPQYLSLSQQEQTEAQKNLIRHLYNKCFPKGVRWLIVIDDAEFMDDESWTILQWCAHESYAVVFLLTVGQRRVLSKTATSVLDSFNVKTLTLTEIEKWFYSGLACQILGVTAIPVELESLMQNYKNSGNPGWLESFLLTLLQSGSIYIHQATTEEIKSLRLISVPEEMLSTAVATEDEKYENSFWHDCVETFEQKSNLEHKKCNICLLGPNFFDHNKNETDLTMDTMVINTIDTLKPLEQMVLKSGSVLGNNFKRSALKYLISKEIATIDERQLAKAIRNLFEIKILTCAKGNESLSNVMVPRRMILVTSIRKEIKCECSGITITDDCKDLPQYASCSFMQFRSPIFRDTVYSLLLDDQKKKYHNYSIEYLRKYTNKCKMCQNIPFKNVIGCDVGDQMTLVCNVSPMHGVRTTKLEPNMKFPMLSIRDRFLICGHGRHSTEHRESLQNFEVEFAKSSVGGGGNCQCSEILASVYSVLLEHASGSGRKDVMLEIQLEYASLSLTSYNIPLTMQILEDALALVNQMKEDKEYPEFCTPYVYSKIYTLMGATKLSIGRPDTSIEFLETSLRHMKKILPKNKMKIKFLIRKENLKRLLMTEYFPEKFIGKTSDKMASICDLLSECLGFISLVHMYMQDWLMAKYASTLALNKALESNRNFYGLCTAYTNMIDVAYHYKDLATCSKMEICAIDICRRCKKRIIEVYELEAICRLYKVIFQARHIRAKIKEAVSIGFLSIRIAAMVRSTSLRLDLMPDLIFALIQLNRLSEAASLLHELEFTSQLDSDKSSRIWYYALCLDFQLDSGFTVIPYETCQNFVKEEEESFITVRDPNCKYRLYSGLWLWCIRNDEWDLSKSYAKTLKSFNIINASETPCAVFTRLRRLEGFLISLVHRLDTKNIYAITSTYTEIHTLMAKLEKDTRVVKLLKPRYLLLKAYYRQIKYHDDSCFRILNQAVSLAEKMQDKNTYEWIIHLQMVWSNAISPIQRDYWIEHCRDNLIDWHEAEGTTKKQSVMYSLPLPKF